ncbi:hypothetical protein lerEdw1_012821, partial [Lerista edwardsae]
KSHGFKLPEWASSEILDQLKEMLTDRLSVLYGTYYRKAKSRMQGGVLLKDILEKITKATQSAPEAKMIMYSAYGVTIIALQMALNVFKRILPSYAACYFFELYQESKGMKSTVNGKAASQLLSGKEQNGEYSGTHQKY